VGADGLAAAFATRTGRVTAFDDHVGSGTVVTDDGADSWSFHCTRIADGSRTIEVGAPVRFEVVPGPTGLEAVALRPKG
jgi:cold shock CspA family protein